MGIGPKVLLDVNVLDVNSFGSRSYCILLLKIYKYIKLTSEMLN